MRMRKRLNTLISTMIMGSLLVGFPIRNSAYSQSKEDQIVAKAQQLNRTGLQEAEQAALDLLSRANAGQSIDPQYYRQKRDKILAALNDMERVGFCQVVTNSIVELAPKYNPTLPQEFVEKLRAAGVSQAEIDRWLNTPKADVVQQANVLSQSGYCAFLRQKIELVDRELAANSAGTKLQRVSFVKTAVISRCATAMMKLAGTIIGTAGACFLGNILGCAGGILVSTGQAADAQRDCSR